MARPATKTLRDQIADLNRLILEGRILDAFDRYYADDVVMVEDGKRREGKEANREYEEAFVNGLTEFRGAEVRQIAVNTEVNVAFVEWWMDFTHEEWGDVELHQVAVQQWRDGEIVHEQFFKAG